MDWPDLRSTIQRPCRPGPHYTFVIFVDGVHKRFTKTVRIALATRKKRKWSSLSTKKVWLPCMQANPNISLVVLAQRNHTVLGEALEIARMISVASKNPMLAVKPQ